MKFSTKIRYGLRIMYELAINFGNEKNLLQKDIVKKQHLPQKYVEQLFEDLKRANLIYSPRGKGSGYILTKSPKEITILEIHNAFEPNIFVIDCLSPNVVCEKMSSCPTIDFWSGLNEIVINYFQKNTLEDLVNNCIKRCDSLQK